LFIGQLLEQGVERLRLWPPWGAGLEALSGRVSEIPKTRMNQVFPDPLKFDAPTVSRTRASVKRENGQKPAWRLDSLRVVR
jgi:hypothetical protein